MPVYDYTALDARGKKTSGIIDAESGSTARQKLRVSKIYPISIEEVQDIAGKNDQPVLSVGRIFNRVKPSEIAMMTRQLATLVGAGLPLVSAIDTVVLQTGSGVFKKILSQIKEAIVEGKSFFEALSIYPGIFPSLYTNMVQAGESSGTLEIVLDRLADIAEKQQALNNRIKAALAYPIFMTVLGAAILFALLTYIVPSITSIFLDMNQVLPLPTRILIRISDFLKDSWWLLILGGAVAIFALRKMIQSPRGRTLADRTILRLPGIGMLVKKIAVIRVTRTLGSLLENGVSMLPALEIVKNVAGNTLIANAIEEASDKVEKGQGLSVSLEESHIFPDLPIQMIQVGEQSGQLEPMLNKVAEVFENEVEAVIMSLTSLLQPIMLLIMGSVVLFIILSILLPIFEMNQLVF
ncbi:MAG: type II secretion system inner membrane protein GspF [Desulfobacterales bacterium]